MTRYLEIKPGSLSEIAIRLRDDYQAVFKAELEKTGKGLAQMTDAEKKAFFNKIDKMHNAKSEMAQTMPAKKPDDSKTTMVVKPGAPAGQEKVMRIPVEKLADYKKKGYVEAESYIPEAKKIDELTAGQKKLPPALQKAIKAKEKSEAVDNPYAVGMAAAMKSTGDKPPLKKSTIVKAHDIAKSIEKKEEVEITEGQYKEIDIRKGDLKLAKDKRQALKDKYNAIMANQAQGDEDSIADQIQKLDMSIKKQEQELIDIMKKSKDSEKKEAVEGIEEAVGPNRITNLNDKISRLQLSISKLDKSKPESKTKEAILKSDLNTAKLRLTDIMKQNAAKAVNEANKAKQSYKSLKMSLKKEQDMDSKKKTLTDKPITKIEVNPKIEG
jgi:hypothetical protein